MENGIGIDAKLGERDNVNMDEPEPTVEENVELDGSKDFDEDEVFEEVVEAKSPIADSENSTMTKDEVCELIGTLENKEGNADVFHEAVATPSAAQSSDGDGLKTQIFNDDKQIDTEGIFTGERNGLLDDIIAESNDSNLEGEKGNHKEMVDSAATADKNVNLDDGNEKLQKSNQKPEDEISHKKKSFLEALTSGDAKTADADNREEEIIEMSETLEPNELIRAETNLKKLEFVKFPNVMKAIQDVKTIGGDISSETPANGSLGHESLVRTVNNEVVEIESADALKQTHELFSEIKDGERVNEQDDILGSERQLDSHEIDSVGVRPELERDQDGEDEKSCISSVNVEDEESTEQKKLDFEFVQGERVDSQAVGQEESISIPASDNFTTDLSNGSSGLHANLHSAIEDSKLVKEKVEVPHLSSPELIKSSTYSQPNLVDSSAEVSANDIDRPEQAGEKEKKEEQSLLGDREKEVTPVAGISSSSGNSSTSGLSPAHHACLSNAAKIQGPVSQDTSANAKKENEPAAGISSSGNSSTSGLSPAHHSSFSNAAKIQGPVSQDTSANAKLETKPVADNPSSANSLKPRPTGLGHAGALPEPASQNKDSRPRSTTALPSTNITRATPARPAGLGRAAPLLEPTSRVVQHPRVNGAVSATQNQLIEDPTNGEGEEYDETREKLQMIRVKFLRLAHRLGQTPHNVVVAQVLYRLGLAEQLHGRSGGRVAAFSFDRASAMAEQLEAAGQEPLDFTCTIMVIGKSGVGKSATINSIFDESMFGTDAFELGTKKVQDVVGTVQGIRVRVIDTPGLLPSWSDQRDNERILRSVKRFIKKTPPDIVLYLDRLDMQSRDFGDMPLLRTITEIFGPSIWFNAIVVLSHAASAPPEGPNGTTTSYDMFVTQRSHVVQQAIRQAAGDMRLMNPVSLVENHSACRTNRAGQRVLPNGQIWKPHLLLLSFASKILAEANTLLKLQDTPPGRPFAPRTKSPPLPFLLSSLLQSRPEVQLPSEQFGDDDALDDLDDSSDSEEESEYDQLPPFKSLTKAQLEKLSKVQRKAYYDELELREKLFMKKQLKEERKRRKMMKKMQEAAKNMPIDYGENDEETNAAASVPVPMPDLALPASFDSDNPTYRYRSLDSSNPWLVRAVLEPQGWDHDIGYDGINVERLFVVKDKIPISFSGHISKDKKDANLQMEIASSVKHGKGKTTSLGFDMQPVGKDFYAYTLRSETRFSNRRMNKATAGLSATMLGDVLTGGMKVEDKLLIGKRGQLVISGGGIYGRGEVAYGGSLEATLRDKDHPLGRFLSTLGISVMDWHGDVSLGLNSQTQIPIGRHTNLIGRFNVNNRGAGQVSIKMNSSEQLQIVLVGLIPLAKKILGYSQPVQYG
ncbi:hypothetical protein ACS0TY_001632 [Phlomoides rotata]